MKAAYINEHGGPEKVLYGDRPEPKAGPRDVVLHVRASALNHTDLMYRAGGRAGVKDDFPRILGCDMAGEIVEIGPEVTGFKKGDRVLVDNRTKCGVCQPCLQGQDNFCTKQQRIGIDVDGGHAEYCRVPAVNAYRFPDWMSFEEAAAVPLAFHTAWQCLVVRGQLQPWENVLIQAAGSGVGSAAIQMAKHLGARVITTASTDEKLAKGKALGADETINYTAIPKFADRVKELTNGKGVDLILDVVGASVWEQNLLSLKEGGRLVITGTTSGTQGITNLPLLQGRPLTLMGSGGRTRKSFGDMMTVVNRAKLHGVVGQVFPLKDVAKAHQMMEDRSFFGKLVIKSP